MSDRTFERSVIGLTALVVLVGLTVEIIGGGALLQFWGKSYMARE